MSLYKEFIKISQKVSKLIYLEMVMSDNKKLKRGILNSIILQIEEIKKEHLGEEGGNVADEIIIRR